MNALESETLTHALKRCYDYPNYRVGSVFNSVRRKIDFLHTMHRLIRNGDVPGAVMMTKTDLDTASENTFIRFQNGSKIEAILGGQTLRGQGFHEILLDFTPTDNEIEYLESIIVRYMYNEDTDIEDDAQALDEFLNGFTIHCGGDGS